MRCVYAIKICVLKCKLLAFTVPGNSTFIRTNGHGQIDSAIDPDQEYINILNVLVLQGRIPRCSHWYVVG